MPMKEEELYTILLFGGLIALYIVPAIIIALFRAGAIEYMVALTIFILIGAIFWPEDAVLRG